MFILNDYFNLPFNPWEKNNKKETANFKNSKEFSNWFMYYSNLYLNLFKWNGLPKSVNERHLELTLFSDGKALFFKDNDDLIGNPFLALQCAQESSLDIYYEPQQYRAIGNGYSKSYTTDESVLIRENKLMYPPIFMIERLTEKISDSSRAIEVYSQSMKRPYLVNTDEDNKMTSKVLVDMVQNNELIVLGRKKGGFDTIQVEKTPLDGQGLLALWKNKHELQDEILTWMGINNANTEKKERLIKDEVNSNNQLIKLNLDNALDMRKKACEMINEMFKLNISCEINHDYLIESEELNNDESSTDKGDN